MRWNSLAIPSRREAFPPLSPTQGGSLPDSGKRRLRQLRRVKKRRGGEKPPWKKRRGVWSVLLKFR
jgi:hypothetical protein